MNSLIKKIDEKFLKSAALVLFVIYSIFAVTAYTADSEFWTIALSKLLYSFDGHIALLQKLPFYFILNIPYHIFADSLLVLMMEKSLFYLVSVGIFYFCYKILLFYKIDNKVIFLFFISLFLFESVFSQTFRIRSDNLALLFFLILFYMGLLDSSDTLKQTVRFFLLSLLMFLITPKAIYFLVLFFLYHVYNQKLLFKRLKSILLFFLLPPFICLFVGFILDKFQMPYLKDAYTKAVLYFLNSFNRQSFQSTYLSLDSFNFLLRAVFRSPIHIIFIFASIFAGLKFRKKLNNNEVILIPIIILGVLFLVFHNQKLPFFINSLLLPVFLFSFIIFAKCKQCIAQPFPYPKIAILFVALTLTYSVYQISHLIIKQNGLTQISTVSKMQSYFSQYPESEIYDGIGILNSGNVLHSFAGPDDRNMKMMTLELLKEHRPDFIIYVPKLFELEPQLSLLLEYQYIPIANGVWAYANQNEGHDMSTSFKKMELGLPYDISYYFAFEWSELL